MSNLTKKAIAALERGESPLDHGFLVKNDVSIDDAYGLADEMALGLRLVRYCTSAQVASNGERVIMMTALGACLAEQVSSRG